LAVCSLKKRESYTKHENTSVESILVSGLPADLGAEGEIRKSLTTLTILIAKMAASEPEDSSRVKHSSGRTTVGIVRKQ